MLIFATGSGISPVKALIDANALKATERKDVRLYYGVHDQDHLAYGDRCATAVHHHAQPCVCCEYNLLRRTCRDMRMQQLCSWVCVEVAQMAVTH